MIEDTPSFNVHFVSIIERHPIIYDFHNDGYSDKNLVNKTWEDISRKINASVGECKERWKNLRGSFTRHVKYLNSTTGSGFRKKKAYYLAKYMNFLLPFLKSRENNKVLMTLNSIDSAMSDFECDDEQTYQNIKQEDDSDSQLNAKSSDDECSFSAFETESLSPKIVKKIRVDTKSQSRTTLQDDNKSVSEYVVENKTKVNSGIPTEYDDPDVLFLMSILPDLRKMNDKQKRRYKIEILSAAERILDDTDGS